MQALTDVVRAGKARYIGFSEWAPEQIRTAMALPGVEGFISSQPQYSLLHRGPEAEVIPLSAANGVSQGVLPGKYIPGAKLPAQSRAASHTMGQMMQSYLQPAILAGVQHLKPWRRRPAAR
jgi:aryl-alcohol dehydrogenase-like predicted oxidoreductase